MKRKSFFGLVFSALLLCSGPASAYDGPVVNINFEPADQTANWGYRYDIDNVAVNQQIQMNIDYFTGDIMQGWEWYEAYTPGGEVLGYNEPLIMPDAAGWTDMGTIPDNKDRTPFWVKFSEAGDYVVAFDLAHARMDIRAPGDVNGDGDTNVIDALMAAQFAADILELSIIDQIMADLDGDGEVTCNSDPGVDSDCEEIALLGL